MKQTPSCECAGNIVRMHDSLSGHAEWCPVSRWFIERLFAIKEAKAWAASLWNVSPEYFDTLNVTPKEDTIDER